MKELNEKYAKSLRKRFDKKFELIDDMEDERDLQTEVFNFMLDELAKWQQQSKRKHLTK